MGEPPRSKSGGGWVCDGAPAAGLRAQLCHAHPGGGGFWRLERSAGCLDVSVNSQAITVEEAMGRPINSSFQGFWSLGSLCAASSLGLLMHTGFSPTTLI